MGFIKSFFTDQSDILTSSKLAADSYNLIAEISLINLDARSIWAKGEIERVGKETFKNISKNNFSSMNYHTWALLLLYALALSAKKENDKITERNAIAGINNILDIFSDKIDLYIRKFFR